MNQARQNILSRLRQAKPNKINEKLSFNFPHVAETGELTEQFVCKLKENYAEVHQVNSDNWMNSFAQIAKKENAKHCLLGQNLAYQDALAETLSLTNEKLKVTRFNAQYENLKEILFHEIDISLTQAQAAIAETGTLVLIPDKNEPRTMSLIPPIHVVLIHKDQIVDSLSAFIDAAPWGNKDSMPSNILFISSPSKTADIQQTLAYGAHGPKKLIVLVMN